MFGSRGGEARGDLPMNTLLRTLEQHGAPDAAAKALLVLALFVAASMIARLARIVAVRIDAHGALAARETAVSLVHTTVGILAFVVAFALSLVVITGARSASALAGASFVAVVVAFAAQRFLVDLLAGLVMFIEGWYTVGTTIVVEPWKLEGVVEEISLRATKIRDVSGDVLRVHNSQVLAVRVLPGGAHSYEIELFVHDADAGERLLDSVASIVPAGATAFVRPPHLRARQELDDDLHRLTAVTAVASGRRWLAEDLLPSLMKERAPDDLIVHGPVLLPVDEQSATRFARAERLLRSRRRRPRALR
jgi:moderate conductance mechanosensitive channel